jgi:ankyrin repeat protein
MWRVVPHLFQCPHLDVIFHSAHQRARRMSTDQLAEMFFSALRGDVDNVMRILDTGVDINTKSPSPPAHVANTLLHVASRGNTELVSALLKRGADVNVRDSDGDTPLQIATETNEELISIFVEHGADVNAKNGIGWTPLHFVGENGNAELD